MDRSKELYIDGDITKANYEKRKTDLKYDLDNIERGKTELAKELQDIEDAIEKLKNPNFLEQLKLMAAVGDITNESEMRDIVRKHIKEATIEFIDKNFLIIVRDKKGIENRIIYDYSKKKCDIFGKLRRITKSGVVPYSHSHKPMSEIFQQSLNGAINVLDGQK